MVYLTAQVPSLQNGNLFRLQVISDYGNMYLDITSVGNNMDLITRIRGSELLLPINIHITSEHKILDPTKSTSISYVKVVIRDMEEIVQDYRYYLMQAIDENRIQDASYAADKLSFVYPSYYIQDLVDEVRQAIADKQQLNHSRANRQPLVLTRRIAV